MKTYWYAAGLKGGGVMVFSAPRKYTKITARQLRTRFNWLSKPHTSQRDAAVFLGQKVGFRNPPQKVTVLHQGKITVQHLSDPRRVKKNPVKASQPKTFSRWQATCRRMYGNIVTFFKEAGKTYCTYHGQTVGFWDMSSRRGIVYAKSNPKKPVRRIVLDEEGPKGMFWDPEELRWRRKTKKTMEEMQSRYGGARMLKPKRKKNPPRIMEMMFQKWKQQCQQKHPNGNVQGNAYGAMCTNKKGDRMGMWNGEDGWVA